MKVRLDVLPKSGWLACLATTDAGKTLIETSLGPVLKPSPQHGRIMCPTCSGKRIDASKVRELAAQGLPAERIADMFDRGLICCEKCNGVGHTMTAMMQALQWTGYVVGADPHSQVKRGDFIPLDARGSRTPGFADLWITDFASDTGLVGCEVEVETPHGCVPLSEFGAVVLTKDTGPCGVVRSLPGNYRAESEPWPSTNHGLGTPSGIIIAHESPSANVAARPSGLLIAAKVSEGINDDGEVCFLPWSMQEVVAVGADVVDLSPGDRVLYARNTGTPFAYDGRHYLKLTKEHIPAKVTLLKDANRD